jgi:hypothetical protein
MANSKQLRRLATSPADWARFLATGKLPRGVVPSSPLISFLERIAPRDLARISGVTIDERVGYQGSRVFATASHALRWLKPSPEVFGSFPAESWRIKNYSKPISWSDFARCCANIPGDIQVKHGLVLGAAEAEGVTPRRPRP